MPTPHRRPVRPRIPRPRHRRRRRKRPASRPPRLRHPHRLPGRRNRRDARCKIAQTGRRAARVVWIDVRAYPVDFVDYGFPVAVLPDVGRVDVAERPVDAGGKHGGARLADVVEDAGCAGAVAIEVFAADGDADYDAVFELWILLYGGCECVEFVRDYRLAARAPDSEQQSRACVDGCLEGGGGGVGCAVFDHGV